MDTMISVFSESFWYIAPFLVSLTTILTGVINKEFSINKNFVKQLISWIIGSLLSISSWSLGFVNLNEPTWFSVTSLCIVVGLASNGFYDIPTIKNWINSWLVKKSE